MAKVYRPIIKANDDLESRVEELRELLKYNDSSAAIGHVLMQYIDREIEVQKALAAEADRLRSERQ